MLGSHGNFRVNMFFVCFSLTYMYFQSILFFGAGAGWNPKMNEWNTYRNKMVRFHIFQFYFSVLIHCVVFVYFSSFILALFFILLFSFFVQMLRMFYFKLYVYNNIIRCVHFFCILIFLESFAGADHTHWSVCNRFFFSSIFLFVVHLDFFQSIKKALHICNECMFTVSIQKNRDSNILTIDTIWLCEKPKNHIEIVFYSIL